MNQQSTPSAGDQHSTEPSTTQPTESAEAAESDRAVASEPRASAVSSPMPDQQSEPELSPDALLEPRRAPPPRTAVGRALRTRTNQRLRARRVRRLVRHIEPWSVLKVSLILYFCVWVIMLFVGVTLWNLAESSGLVSNIENFVVELFALESFTINADQIFRIAAVGGLVMVVAGSGLTVLVAVLFNLISDVTGGVRLTVVEEETARPRARRGRRRVLVAAPPPNSPDPRTRR